MTTGYIPTLAQVDELHRKIAQSQAAYDLIHGHCVVVADIARRMARRQNALFTRRCTLPDDAPEKAGDFACLAWAVCPRWWRGRGLGFGSLGVLHGKD